MSVYSSKLFTYYPARRRFIAEKSDLGRGVIFDWVPGINNAGITVQSYRTGNTVRFMIVNRKISDGDTQYWDLIPVFQDQIAFNIGDVTMRIYND